MTCLVNEVLPTAKTTKTSSDYIRELINKGFNKYQAVGSLGGAANGKTISIVNGVVTRCK